MNKPVLSIGELVEHPSKSGLIPQRLHPGTPILFIIGVVKKPGLTLSTSLLLLATKSEQPKHQESVPKFEKWIPTATGIPGPDMVYLQFDRVSSKIIFAYVRVKT